MCSLPKSSFNSTYISSAMKRRADTPHMGESPRVTGRCRSPPQGGLPAVDKPTTLPSHEYRDEFSGARLRTLSLSACDSVLVRGADAGFTGWLRRRALAQYLGLVLSVLDGLRAGRNCVGTRSPGNFQGLGNARGTARPLRRDAGGCLCRHLRDVADMAVLNNSYE